MSLSLTRTKVHITNTNLSAMRDEIAALNIDPDTVWGYHLLKSHLLREFNKRALITNQTGEMISPYDGGLRPIDPILDVEVDNLLLISGDDIILIGGDSILLI